MSCDIHFFVEHKQQDRWVIVKTSSDSDAFGSFNYEWDVGRDYDLFNLLAYVRGQDLPLMGGQIKPMPEDLSEEVCFYLQTDNIEYYPQTFHSHHRMSRKEFLEFDWAKSFRGGAIPAWEGDFKSDTIVKDFISNVIEPIKKLYANTENVCCIYAFDN